MASILNATTTSGLVTSADNSGSLQLQTNNGTTAVTIDTSQTTTINSPSSTPLIVQSASTERMRITSSGLFLVNATSSIDVAGVNSDHALVGTTGNGRWATAFRNTGNSTPWGIAVNYNNAAPNNTSQNFVYCYDSGAERFSVRSNGGVANYSGNNVNLSDEREKTNIELAGSYLDKICTIPVKTFNYIDQNREEDDGLTLGVIAQDVQKVAPELVIESNWGTKEEPKMRLSIYQTDLQYALMKCIQELKAELDATKAEVQALKGVA